MAGVDAQTKAGCARASEPQGAFFLGISCKRLYGSKPAGVRGRWVLEDGYGSSCRARTASSHHKEIGNGDGLKALGRGGATTTQSPRARGYFTVRLLRILLTLSLLSSASPRLSFIRIYPSFIHPLSSSLPFPWHYTFSSAFYTIFVPFIRFAKPSPNRVCVCVCVC